MSNIKNWEAPFTIEFDYKTTSTNIFWQIYWSDQYLIRFANPQINGQYYTFYDNKWHHCKITVSTNRDEVTYCIDEKYQVTLNSSMSTSQMRFYLNNGGSITYKNFIVY